MTGEKIQMLDYQKPGLEAGDYRISIAQTINGTGIGDNFGTKVIDFIVTGDRFALSSGIVHACFPPEGDLGRHTDVLPHISLTRSTLPWERSAYGNDDFEPWMALLLFDEEEMLENQVVEQALTVNDLATEPVTLADDTTPKPAFFPNFTLESGQVASDKVNVINVKRSLLEKLLPSGEVLKLLTHVRRRVNGDQNNPESELAVVVCNRLPKEGSESTVYLVSLEGRYGDDGNFDYPAGSGADDYIRLVNLKKWGFACLPELGKNFEELIEAISVGSLRPSHPSANDPPDVELERYLVAGYSPLPHRLRQCDRTYSWYHGPLSPQPIAATFTTDDALPEFADALIRYHQDIGMFDVSYAAAFEIGRVLALTDERFSASLYQWKQQYNETILAQLQETEARKLLAMSPASESSQFAGDNNALELSISQWLSNLQNLAGIPFNYLIPDNAMLPAEAIRFFQLDQHWLESLLYGAFSIGGIVRTTPSGGVAERIGVLQRFYTVDRPVSGFIVRSKLISGYPDVQVDGYSLRNADSNPLDDAETSSKLEMLRVERLGPDVMIGLFAGEIATAELYLKPEGLRFGLDVEAAGLSKDLSIKVNNEYTSVTIVPRDGQSWLPDDPETRVLNINYLAQAIQAAIQTATGSSQTIVPAVFAMHMLEGSNKGRFAIKA